MKRTIIDNLKNLFGWKTDRKIVVFSVDDYGNVRLDSKQACENMDKAGLKVDSRFDAYDTLETRQDLEALYEVLTSVTDKNGNNVVFTPFALPCNINFEAMAEEGYKRYIPELLPQTYRKLEERHSDAYAGAWKLWQEGIEKGLMVPQFHGREHLNLKVFEEKLRKKSPDLIACLENRSYSSISHHPFDNIRYTAAFSFDKKDEINAFPSILKTGTEAFKQVYGITSACFTPPAQEFPPSLEQTLRQYGIRYLDRPFYKKRHLGNGNYTHSFSKMGNNGKSNLAFLVRNVVFEPTNGVIDHVNKAMDQITAAFRMNKPALISSHRVNFCGHIDPQNRETGLTALHKLLQNITESWPDVEFMHAAQLGNLIKKSET